MAEHTVKELKQTERMDTETVCPMCGEKDSKVVELKDRAGFVVKEVHICQPCPCVWFDYHEDMDVIRLFEILL